MENRNPPKERVALVRGLPTELPTEWFKGVGRMAILAAACLISPYAHAEAPDLRLIETSEGQRAWMSFEEIAQLSEKQHAAGKCGGFFDVTARPLSKTVFAAPLLDFESRPITEAAQVRPMLSELSADNIYKFVEKLSSFHNRYYQSDTGKQAAEWIAEQFRAFGAGRADVQVELIMHPDFIQPSVIARIVGKNPSLAGQRVVIGAHLDSVNWKSSGEITTRRAPGADDDASGIATLLEAFRVIAQSGFQPERTLEFMGYAGEELGLLGSQDISERYERDRIPVVAVLQLDMTMMPGPSRKLQMITDHVHEGLTSYTGRLLTEYTGMPWEMGVCGYGCSDHASWTRAGFASAFPFESPEDINRLIHSERDTLDTLEAAFGLHFSKLAVAFAAELSSR